MSTALVLLIMSLFAQIFQIAAGTLHTQRGIAENDQRARSMVTTLNADLGKRTFRQREDLVTQTDTGTFAALLNVANNNALGITPLHPDYFVGGESQSSQRLVDGEREGGYFYISEGDPFNDGDDVLQFTVNAAQTDLGSDDTTPFAGRARRLGGPGPPRLRQDERSNPAGNASTSISRCGMTASASSSMSTIST